MGYLLGCPNFKKFVQIPFLKLITFTKPFAYLIPPQLDQSGARMIVVTKGQGGQLILLVQMWGLKVA